MTINEYKIHLKQIIDNTDAVELLSQWKEQLEWDVKNIGDIELSPKDWQAQSLEVGEEDVISFEEYRKKQQNLTPPSSHTTELNLPPAPHP